VGGVEEEEGILEDTGRLSGRSDYDWAWVRLARFLLSPAFPRVHSPAWPALAAGYVGCCGRFTQSVSDLSYPSHPGGDFKSATFPYDAIKSHEVYRRREVFGSLTKARRTWFSD
jgi:hypothetical protein